MAESNFLRTESSAPEIKIDISNAEQLNLFVDTFFKEHGLTSPASRGRIETLLRHMPSYFKIQREITSWVRKNWDNKSYLR
jgi:hypothetical protein